MRYHEYHPPVELAPWIKLFWVFENRSNDPIPETIVADGFPELIIHFGSPFAEVDPSGRIFQQPMAVCCGQLTKPLLLHSSPDAGMIGIRFQPSGMAAFLSSPMKSLTDRRVSAHDLFPDIDRLIEGVRCATTDLQRVSACNRFLARSVNIQRARTCLPLAIEKIMHTRGNISVKSLAGFLGTSRRSLELAFQSEVGTSPKMYCRITRFRHLYDAVTEDSPTNWVQIALDSGYFDQSHLIRDFRQFAGATPISFLAERTSFAHSVNQT